jgi:hypothetical protein
MPIQPESLVIISRQAQTLHLEVLGSLFAMNLPVSSYEDEHTYVALATLLPSDLRAQASAANLCFFQVVDHAAHAERLFVRATALPHRLNDLDAPRVFTVCLTTEQLAQALPWDRTMQARPTCDVRELVELHTKQVCAGTFPSQPVAPIAAPASPQQQENIELVTLPEVFVSCETVQEVIVEMQPPQRNAPQQKQQRWVRLTWLHAAIAMLRRQCSHVVQLQGILHAYLAALDHAIRCAFVVQHRLHQPLVCASPVFIEGRQVGGVAPDLWRSCFDCSGCITTRHSSCRASRFEQKEGGIGLCSIQHAWPRWPSPLLR